MNAIMALTSNADSMTVSGFWSLTGLAIGYGVGRVHCWLQERGEDDGES